MTWLVALALAVAVTAGLEHTTRAHGQRPSVVDDPVLWGVARQQLGDDPAVVAILGTSRMELAYAADAFAEAAPERRGVQLAIDGVPPFGVLEDLADDPGFRGLAIVDVAEWDFLRADAFTAARPYVDRSHALWRAPGALVNRVLASVVQARLAVLAIGGRELITALLGKRRWPEPKWVVTSRDRTFHGDYGLATPDALQKRRDKGLHSFPDITPDPQAWLAEAMRVEPLVQRIRSHGGEVVFVHLPISGRLAELADQKYPRAQYWDLFAARTSAKVLHFRDVPALAALQCPDSMHLDQRDQRTFTLALVAALRERGVLTSR